jgi:hypothetical protein
LFFFIKSKRNRGMVSKKGLKNGLDTSNFTSGCCSKARGTVMATSPMADVWRLCVIFMANTIFYIRIFRTSLIAFLSRQFSEKINQKSH